MATEKMEAFLAALRANPGAAEKLNNGEKGKTEEEKTARLLMDATIPSIITPIICVTGITTTRIPRRYIPGSPSIFAKPGSRTRSKHTASDDPDMCVKKDHMNLKAGKGEASHQRLHFWYDPERMKS